MPAALSSYNCQSIRLSILFCVYCNLVIYRPISSFHTWITFISSQPSLNMGLVQGMITKMADKMAAACQIALVDTLN